jgi:hypothetical protein
MNSRLRGEELSQLARLMFDACANKWYAALGLEVFAGFLALVLDLLNLPSTWALGGAVVGVVLLGIAYYLRLQFEDQYHSAETMRRQSVFTEALNWPLSTIQYSEWQRKAGKRIRAKLKITQREGDYYETQKAAGPERLAEMTAESAFYTRHLYLKLQWWLWALFITAACLFILVSLTTLIAPVPDNVRVLVAKALYSFILIVLSANLLGWALKLGRLASTIQEVEEGLERLKNTSALDVPQVMRLVSEYNCQVVEGIPVHSWLFRRWHDEIRDLWENRLR